MPRVDEAAAEQARQRLAEFSPTPSAILHEGDRVVGIWLVTERINSLGQVEQLLRALATALGGDYVPPQEALLAVPGTRNTRLHPAHTMQPVGWEPGRRYAWNELACP